MKFRSKNFSGLSLVEMMIAISIFTMAIGGFSMLYIRSLKSNSYTIEMGQTSFALSQGMSKMVEYIRIARQGDNGNAAIVSVEDNSLTLYADYDNDNITERLHFYLDSTDANNKKIQMGVRDPSGGAIKTYAAGDASVIMIAQHIVNEADDKLFQYYNSSYPANMISNPISPVTGNVATIRMVEIFLKMNIDVNRGPENIEMRSFATLRNLSDYNISK